APRETTLPDVRPAMQTYDKVERDTGEYGEAEPMIVEKRAKACFAFARADPPHVLDRKRESDGKSRVIRRPHRISKADERHRAEIDRIAQRNRRDVEAAECQRRRTNVDGDVVVAVNHRIFGIVGD